MPAKRELTMRQLRHILRLHHDGVSAREIGRRLAVPRTTIQDSLKRAQAAAVVSPHQVMEVDARARLCQWPAKTVKELRAVVATLPAGRRKAETRTVRRLEQESRVVDWLRQLDRAPRRAVPVESDVPARVLWIANVEQGHALRWRPVVAGRA